MPKDSITLSAPAIKAFEDELARAARVIETKVFTKAAHQAMSQASSVIESLTPVETGALKRSIRRIGLARKSKGRASWLLFLAKDPSNPIKPAAVEFGHDNVPPVAMMQIARRVAVQVARKVARKEINILLRDVKRRISQANGRR